MNAPSETAARNEADRIAQIESEFFASKRRYERGEISLVEHTPALRAFVRLF